MRPEAKLEAVAAFYKTDAHWLYVRCLDLFGRSDLTGLRVLDVGAGRGMHSCAMAALNAQQVIALEPQLDGSRAGVTEQFKTAVRELGLHNLVLLPDGLEQYEAEPESFDLILMYAVINHLDERHVQTLHYDAGSRARYVALLRPVLNWLKPGAPLVIYDAARHHALELLLRLHVLKRHPLFPTIEWHKHQNPKVWEAILAEVGFSHVRHHWAAFTRYDRIRALVGSSALAAYLIAPLFVIRAFR